MSAGLLTYHPRAGLNGGRSRPMWAIQAEPYVMTRVKRMFGRVEATRNGAVLISDSIEVARDLEWLLERYELEVDDDTLGRLRDGAAAHREQEVTVQRVLSGGQLTISTDGFRAPARAPRPAQLVAADLTISTGRLLCTDPLGAGKSMTGVLVLRAPDALPALVVTLTGRLPEQWCEEVQKTLPELRTHILTNGDLYDPAERCGYAPDVIVCNYGKLAKWSDHLAGQVNTVIFDEVQELRHPGTNKYVAAAQIADRARYKMGLSNTPIFNYGGEAFNPVDILAPGALGTREEFLREWCSEIGNGKHKVKDPVALGAYLRDQGIVLGRTEQELGIELPPAEVQVVTIDSDPKVMDKANTHAAEMARIVLAGAADSFTRMRAAGQLDLEMRQATGVAKAPYVARYVRALLEQEERVLLFGWHRAVYDIWREELAEFAPTLYTGTETSFEKNRTYRAFVDGTSRIMVMSLRAGAGIDGLQQHCRDIVFGELDWTAAVHQQAIGRLRRGGMNASRPVRAHYLVAAEGSDPAVVQVQNLKRHQADPLFNPEARDGVLAPAGTVGDLNRMRLLAQQVLAYTGEVPPELHRQPGIVAASDGASSLFEVVR